MENTRELHEEARALAMKVVVYYTIMLAAFLIGLYGLFSLIWLAGESLHQNAQIYGSML